MTTICPLCRRDASKGSHGHGFCVGSAREARITPADLLRAFSGDRPSWPLLEPGCSRAIAPRSE